MSRRGIAPASRITAPAPAGRTHIGASTLPGSAIPAEASTVADDWMTAAAVEIVDAAEGKADIFVGALLEQADDVRICDRGMITP